MKQFKQYEVESEPFWEELHFAGYDGYDIMEQALAQGWHAIAGWGKEGWNLGNWPYVVVYSRQVGTGYEVALYVEGDMTTYKCPTKELRNQVIDEIAFFYWKRRPAEDTEWIDGYRECESADQLPEHLRGPYRR